MHIVVDAFAVRSGSAAITLENLLAGWSELGAGDQITVVAGEEPSFRLPAGARVEVVPPPLGGAVGTLWARSLGVRRAARRLGADGVVSGVTASGLLGTPCPRGVILYDLRHELRPHQFGLGRRLARRAAYAWSFRSAGAVYCISRRTLGDLVDRHPAARARAVEARYGADHVDRWPPAAPSEGAAPYALAFGQFANKNVDAVLDAWAEFCCTEATWRLRLVGMGRADRQAATERVARLGIEDRVELMSWLDDEQFVACFAGAGLVVFPSDFEGFGLPAVEALRLRIPLVVSDDPALAEVTGGHAETARRITPPDLAESMRRAIKRTPAELDAGRAYTEQFTWRSMASAIRSSLVSAGAGSGAQGR
ncbi:glycosyltransferase [Nocardioides terrisoli]|uniref:glycosyltransferase n=1 Tax=Nocardioides terrisoli TaxID=3388267 RepID=UPI00287BB9BA|nr:glycosyltransferase [Nocardioides marmorisolisilvae]